MASARDKREERVDGAKAWAEKSGGFERTAINAPGGIKFLGMRKAGTLRIDILPFKLQEDLPAFNKEKGDLWFVWDYFTHRNVGVNKDMVICPAKQFKKKCPICEFRHNLGQNATAEEEKLIKQLAPQHRQLWCVHDHSEPDAGPKLLDCSQFGFGKQLQAMINGADEDDNYHLFYHPKKGHTLKVGVTEEPLDGGSWFKASTIEFKPRKEPVDADLLAKVPYLPGLVIEKPYDDLKKAFLQVEDAGDKKAAGGKGKVDKAGKGKKADDSDVDSDIDSVLDSDADSDVDSDVENTGKKSAEPVAWKKGDEVSFSYKGKDYTGKVVRAANKSGVVAVLCPEREEPHNIDAEELVAAKPAKAAKKPAGKAGKGKKDDSDVDDSGVDSDVDSEVEGKGKKADDSDVDDSDVDSDVEDKGKGGGKGKPFEDSDVDSDVDSEVEKKPAKKPAAKPKKK